ncbi:MAG: NAD-dependent epimerase/dehydratase family protein [Candidatus Bipolaricaulia bacterium]
MAKIFLTGATGFVGRHLVPALLRDGHHLRCLVRSAEKAKLLRALGCEIVLGDLLDPHTWGGSLGGAELIIHLASQHQGMPSLIRRTNADGTARLVHAAQAQQVKKILYLSTVTAAPRPRWPYAHSVWCAEQSIRQSSLCYTILRGSVIVGPGDPFLGGILRMAQRWPVVPIVGSGNTRFQPISVHDLVQCILRAISTDRYDTRILALGGPEILSYDQIVRTVLEALQIEKRVIYLPRRATRFCVRWLERLGVKTPFVPGHFLSRDHIASSLTVIEDEFGFRPHTLREVIATIIANRVAQT